jgi:hypothetical protein
VEVGDAVMKWKLSFVSSGSGNNVRHFGDKRRGQAGFGAG